VRSAEGGGRMARCWVLGVADAVRALESHTSHTKPITNPGRPLNLKIASESADSVLSLLGRSVSGSVSVESCRVVASSYRRYRGNGACLMQTADEE
jgi:hypothetical protein